DDQRPAVVVGAQVETHAPVGAERIADGDRPAVRAKPLVGERAGLAQAAVRESDEQIAASAQAQRARAGEGEGDPGRIGAGSEVQVVLQPRAVAVEVHAHARPGLRVANAREGGDPRAPAGAIGAYEIVGGSRQAPEALQARVRPRAEQAQGEYVAGGP